MFRLEGQIIWKQIVSICYSFSNKCSLVLKDVLTLSVSTFRKLSRVYSRVVTTTTHHWLARASRLKPHASSLKPPDERSAHLHFIDLCVGPGRPWSARPGPADPRLSSFLDYTMGSTHRTPGRPAIIDGQLFLNLSEVVDSLAGRHTPVHLATWPHLLALRHVDSRCHGALRSPQCGRGAWRGAWRGVAWRGAAWRGVAHLGAPLPSRFR